MNKADWIILQVIISCIVMLFAAKNNVFAAELNNDELYTKQNIALDFTAAQLLANDHNEEKEILKITYINDNSNGQLSFDLSTGKFSFTPKHNFIGQTSFIYGAQTVAGEKTYATVIINISASNIKQPKIFAVKDKFSTVKNAAINLDVSQLLENDLINDKSIPVSVSFVEDATNGSVDFNIAKKRVTFTPKNDFVGEATFVYAIKDDNEQLSFASVFIEVIETNVSIKIPDADAVGKLFFVGNMSALTYSMQAMLSNINTDFGYLGEYDYQLGGFLFALWGDELSPDGFRASDKPLYAQHNGTVFKQAQGLSAAENTTLIITDGSNAIPHLWGNTSQYLTRFIKHLYQQNNQAQSYFLQSWPYIKQGNLEHWREQISALLPRWQKVISTVNGDISTSVNPHSIYFIPEHEKLGPEVNKVKLIPAGLALAKVYDNYQQGNLPDDGRPFISEMFKSPDYSINPEENGQESIGHLSPEGEYLIALVIHTAIYGRNPVHATNDISFNHRGWSGYSLDLFPETPFPENGLLSVSKAQYYQNVALEVVSDFYGWDVAKLPLRLDSDNDGVYDDKDAFPFNPNESRDSDGDGVGDNSDVFPNDALESQDSDGDGVGDNSDAFPNDASESQDSDGDGVGDNADPSPQGENVNNPTLPQVKLTHINFVHLEASNNSLYLYWPSGNAIRFRILLMSHNQAPRVIFTNETEHTFTNLSVLDGVSTIMIEGFDSLGNSIFSNAVNMEDF